jgi:hypothetical protein
MYAGIVRGREFSLRNAHLERINALNNFHNKKPERPFFADT